VTLDQALEQVNAARDWSFASLGVFAGGEVGASGVIDDGGRRAVAKWEWPADPGAIVRRREAGDIVERLRRRDGRLPEYLAIEPIGAGVLVLQEFMPGAASDHVPATLIDDLVAHNELQAHLPGSGSGWNEYLRASLSVGLDGYCQHSSLEQHSAATRRLLERIHEAGRALGDVILEERDVVHLDFHHRNALANAGRLCAVIDCNGYRPGDRVFDLVTLAFCLAVAERPAAAEQRLWETINRMRDRVIVNAYVAHQALRRVDWSIRYRTSDDLEAWMARSTALLA